MKIAITGGTGFLGRYIVTQLASAGHDCRLWYRAGSDRGGFEAVEDRIEWRQGELGDAAAAEQLVTGCDAVVHAALHHTPGAFRVSDPDLLEFVERNVVGTLRLIEAALAAGAGRFIYISSCAVHDRILSDRPLDETHPTWASNHYGAHKAAVEQFVHSYGFGQGYPICACGPAASMDSRGRRNTASGLSSYRPSFAASRSTAIAEARRCMPRTSRGWSRFC